MTDEEILKITNCGRGRCLLESNTDEDCYSCRGNRLKLISYNYCRDCYRKNDTCYECSKLATKIRERKSKDILKNDKNRIISLKTFKIIGITSPINCTFVYWLSGFNFDERGTMLVTWFLCAEFFAIALPIAFYFLVVENGKLRFLEDIKDDKINKGDDNE